MTALSIYKGPTKERRTCRPCLTTRARPDGFRLLADTDPSSPVSTHRDRAMNAVISRLANRITPTKPDAGVDEPLTAQITAMAVVVALEAARESVIRPGPDPATASNVAAAFVAGGIRSALKAASRRDP